MKDLLQSTMAQHQKSVYISVVKKASLAFLSKDFDLSAAQYRIVLDSLTRTNNENDFFNINLIRYMLCISLMESNELEDLQEALLSLQDLVDNPNCPFPAAYYALAKIHIKFFRFDYASDTIRKGFGFLNKDTQFPTYCIPSTDQIIVESTKKGLLEALIKLKDQCLSWHRPDAVCSMTSCQNHTEQYTSNRNIYFSDPAFTGMVTVMCSNPTYPCVLKFHKSCWEYKKQQMSVSELTNEEIIGHKCLTPNCKVNRVANTITKIELFNNASDSNDVVETSKTMGQSKEAIVVKGAIKKQWNPDNEISEYDDDTTETHESDLGPDFTNDDAETAHLKSFTYGLLLSYVKTNGPITTEEVLKKWDETKLLIPNSDFVLNDHKDIIDFLLQAPKIVRVENYMCVPEMLPQLYNLLKHNSKKQFNDVTVDEKEYENFQEDINVDIQDDTTVPRDSFLTVDQSIYNTRPHQCVNNNIPEYRNEGINNNNNNDNNNRGNSEYQSYVTQGQMYNRPETSDIPNKAASKSGSDSDGTDRNSLRFSSKTHYIANGSPVDKQGNPFLQTVGAHDGKQFSEFPLKSDNFTSDSKSLDTNGAKLNNHDENIEGVKRNVPSVKAFDLLVQEFLSLNDTMDQASHSKPILESSTQENHKPFHKDFNHRANSSIDKLFRDEVTAQTINKLQLLLKEKDSNIKFLKEENEMLKAGLKNVQLYSKTVSDKCKIMQQNETVLKAHINVLLQEKEDSENNITLLLKEKHTVADTYKEISKSLQQETEASKMQLTLTVKEFDDLKLQYFNMKKSMLHKLLDSKFTANTAFIMRNYELCNTCIAVVNRINNVFQRNFGFPVLSDNVEWLQALNGFQKLSTQHQAEYLGIKSVLETEEQVEKTNDVTLTLVDIPPFPSRSLVDVVGDAFGKYANMLRPLHLTPMPSNGLIMSYQQAPRLVLPPPQNTTPQFPNTPNIPASTYPQFSGTGQQLKNYSNETVASVGDLKQKSSSTTDLENTVVKDSNNNKSQVNNTDDISSMKTNIEERSNTEKYVVRIEESINKNENDNQSGNSENKCEDDGNKNNVIILAEESNNDRNCTISDSQDDNAVTIYTENGEYDGENMAQAAKQHCCYNLDKIMLKLRAKYTGMLDSDLLDSLMKVRKRHNNSLTGKTVKIILEEAEKYILTCQEKYLCTYSLTTEKTKAVKAQAQKVTQHQKVAQSKKVAQPQKVAQSKKVAQPQKVKRQKPTLSDLNKKIFSKPAAGPSLENLTKLELKSLTTLKNQRKRLNSAPADTREDNKPQSSTQGKCAWGKIPTINDTWNKDYEETECIICMENIHCKSKPVYTLACKHTFHMACIKSWFQQNQSCPNCRVHCTIDDEYPPLPS